MPWSLTWNVSSHRLGLSIVCCAPASVAVLACGDDTLDRPRCWCWREGEADDEEDDRDREPSAADTPREWGCCSEEEGPLTSLEDSWRTNGTGTAARATVTLRAT